jgi:hypothetical protein
MSASIVSRNSSHFLRIGKVVPSKKVPLALVTMQNPTPSNVIRLNNIGVTLVPNKEMSAYFGKGGRNFEAYSGSIPLPGGSDNNFGSDPIQIKDIISLHGDVWVPRVTAGSFYVVDTSFVVGEPSDPLPDWVPETWTTGDEVIWFYSVPELYNQPYYARDSKIMRVGEGQGTQINYDTPKQLSHNTFQLNFVPLVNSQSISLYVRGTLYSGSIEILDGQNLKASYFYYENNYLFSGYYDRSYSSFMDLDLNPGSGHHCTIVESGAPVSIDSSDLLIYGGGNDNTGVEVYLVPTTAYNNTKQAFANNVDIPAIRWAPVKWGNYDVLRTYNTLGYGNLGSLYLGQLFLPLDVIDTSLAFDMDEDRVPKGVIIARIYAFPFSLLENIMITDVRPYGGGLADDVNTRLIPESRYYFDIGGIEGPAISENGVLIFRVPREKIIEYGEARVRKEIEKFLAAGISYLMEEI